jgi:hypothetical protein
VRVCGFPASSVNLPCRIRGNGYATGTDVALGILILALSVAGVIVVGILFVWAARKDGEEDRALQKRLGIRRRTRLGR